MASALTTRAELVKLARALGTTPDGVSFAASLGPDELRQLRERVVAALYDEHAAAFRRIAAITRMLPTPVNVRITLRAFSPLLAARIAGEMPPDRAAALANRMPVEYLARGCVHLDPRRAAPLIERVDPDRVLAVVTELIRWGDFITLGRVLGTNTEQLTRVAEQVTDDTLLRIATYIESDTQLTRAVNVLPPQRMRDIVHRAMTGPADLRLAGLSVVGRLDDARLRGLFAGYAAEEDDDMLTAMLHTALDEDAVVELLNAVAAMDEPARRRVVALPALEDTETRVRLSRAAAGAGLGELLNSLVDAR